MGVVFDDVAVVFVFSKSDTSWSLLVMNFRGGEERELGYVTLFLYMRLEALQESLHGRPEQQSPKTVQEYTNFRILRK